jgi:hypothetical protein
VRKRGISAFFLKGSYDLSYVEHMLNIWEMEIEMELEMEIYMEIEIEMKLEIKMELSMV